MTGLSRTIALAALAALALTETAEALPSGGAGRLRDLAQGATTIRDGAFATPTRGFTVFCQNYADQCVLDGKDGKVALDEARMRELAEVNDEVNRRILPDPVGRDFDNWSLYSWVGHCNEFAIQKRKELVDRGWPVSALSLAVVHTKYDQGDVLHLVLSVRTDQGDLVLDNLRKTVVPWNKTGYGFVMRQSKIHPRLWVKVEGAEPPTPAPAIVQAQALAPTPATTLAPAATSAPTSERDPAQERQPDESI
jgi:predicted transglutaminase-like cysteine proteinase